MHNCACPAERDLSLPGIRAVPQGNHRTTESHLQNVRCGCTWPIIGSCRDGMAPGIAWAISGTCSPSLLCLSSAHGSPSLERTKRATGGGGGLSGFSLGDGTPAMKQTCSPTWTVCHICHLCHLRHRPVICPAWRLASPRPLAWQSGHVS